MNTSVENSSVVYHIMLDVQQHPKHHDTIMVAIIIGNVFSIFITKSGFSWKINYLYEKRLIPNRPRNSFTYFALGFCLLCPDAKEVAAMEILLETRNKLLQYLR